MNTTITKATEYRDLPLALLTESTTNPRRTFEEDALKELAASIRTQGVLSPLLVRPLNERSFEIVAGARRYRAAQMAEVATVPVRIVNLTDAEAMEAALVENLIRADVHPMEEATGFARLLALDEPKYSIEQLAARTGKNPAYVSARLKLTELAPVVVEGFYRDEIGVGHALLLAKLQPTQQEQALAACFKEDWSAGGQKAKRILLPVRSLQFWIESNVLLILKEAPFDKRDAQLVPAAGSCVDCPKRTGQNKLLFSELSKQDSCSDPNCYQSKVSAHLAKTIAAKPQLVQVSTAYGVQKEGSTTLPRNKYVAIRDDKPKSKDEATRPEFKVCKFAAEAIITDCCRECDSLHPRRSGDRHVCHSGRGSRCLAPVPRWGPQNLRASSQFDFSGEFSLLNSQRSVAEVRTAMESRVLRISRQELRPLMRVEGDIANLIVQATIWRRIGLIAEASNGILLRGCAGDGELMRLQRFLVRNYYPRRMEEIPKDLLTCKGNHAAELPAVLLADGRVLVHPTITALADELGITELPDSQTIYDVAVVGAGPAGLAAAVYAASEGLSTIVIEGTAPGGQAGTSSKIENYLGFPTGISGQQLASRGHLQALKFGVHFAISREIVTAQQIDGVHKLTLAGGIAVHSRSVVIATGAQYRRLAVENHSVFENRGVYYAATAMESLLCRQREIIVVGGGNSAGQAAIFLSSVAKHVHHIVRSPSLESTMSQYLISRMNSSPRITLYSDSEIEKLDGELSLQSVTWKNRRTSEKTTKPVSGVFVMIGAEPNSGWLYGTVKLDKKGFVLTGGPDSFESSPYATSAPGIYAVGDVRANSVKRVASAVGEGSVVISDVHRYLADHRSNIAAPIDSILADPRAASAAKGH